ncbi:MAG TPA: DUF4290 domain-containing protein [Haliscomenobacter sp.]|uniref:DUF4290 domain-containing protein n=1 Tax=Haliscomenobacter sp. TaxID=2717303 RepID=UPI002C6565AE|nr:DUF4290 domain-containing protein [Haliscomenobacter sp.]HOY17105.1 DUF4290 domain-containing protein [Haliscomenobacter sp.]
MNRKEPLNMEYNSQKDELIIPEYGRNVQNMILYAKTIEDDRARQQVVEEIIDMMMMMHPQNRNLEDYRIKLWRHVFKIASYDLKVSPPPGITPSPADDNKKPDKVNYPTAEPGFRHYGNNVQRLIRRAIEMEPGPKRNGFVATIASYMKLAYRTWNKEHFVSDDVIKTDLEIISNGQLSLDELGSIENLTPAHQGNMNNNNNNRRRSNNQGGNNNRQQRNNSGGSGGGRSSYGGGRQQSNNNGGGGKFNPRNNKRK